MSGEVISLPDFTAAFMWEVWQRLPADPAAASFVAGMLNMISASAEAGRPEDVASGCEIVETKLAMERGNE
jgi:hypothetical protein